MPSQPAPMHTPLPWKLGEEPETDMDVDNSGKTIGWYTGRMVWDRCIIFEHENKTTETVCSMHQGNLRANAELIVRAVNHHAALLAALQGLIVAMDGEDLPALIDAEQAARAALSAAQANEREGL